MRKFRHRRGLFGKLILQVWESWKDDGRDYGHWTDARVEDLEDYFLSISQRGALP